MKIIFIFTSVTGLVVYVAYSAALVSILSIKVVPIRTLEDGLKYNYALYHDYWSFHTETILQVKIHLFDYIVSSLARVL